MTPNSCRQRQKRHAKKLQKSFAAETPVPEGEPFNAANRKSRADGSFLKSLGKDGTIIAVNGSEVTVQIGIFKNHR